MADRRVIILKEKKENEKKETKVEVKIEKPEVKVKAFGVEMEPKFRVPGGKK